MPTITIRRDGIGIGTIRPTRGEAGSDLRGTMVRDGTIRGGVGTTEDITTTITLTTAAIAVLREPITTVIALRTGLTLRREDRADVRAGRMA